MSRRGQQKPQKEQQQKTHVIEVLVSRTTIPTQSLDRMCKFEVWLIIYQFLQWIWVQSPLTFLCHPCQLSWHTGKDGHINYLTLFPRVNSKMETGEGGWQELRWQLLMGEESSHVRCTGSSPVRPQHTTTQMMCRCPWYWQSIGRFFALVITPLPNIFLTITFFVNNNRLQSIE